MRQPIACGDKQPRSSTGEGKAARCQRRRDQGLRQQWEVKEERSSLPQPQVPPSFSMCPQAQLPPSSNPFILQQQKSLFLCHHEA